MRRELAAADPLREGGRRLSDVRRARIELAVGRPFELAVALCGHGWYELAPNAWDPAARHFTTVLAADGGSPLEETPMEETSEGTSVEAVDASLTQRGDTLFVELSSRRALSPDARRMLRAALRRMLRLDHDYAPFWRRCREQAGLAWVARRGAGRLLAGATLFEDLMKLLFTTNCSWAATRLMTSRLVDALGARSPSGRAAFPSAAACAREPERFWRAVVRAGYRARAARELAEGFASGALAASHFDPPALPTDEVRRRLLALRGIGPYAAGQALRLLGRHDDLALDSWCRSKLTTLLGRKRPPTDRAIARRYASHGADRGLVLWMELTADWHREQANGASPPLLR